MPQGTAMQLRSLIQAVQMSSCRTDGPSKARLRICIGQGSKGNSYSSSSSVPIPDVTSKVDASLVIVQVGRIMI